MRFGEALRALRHGARVKRAGWKNVSAIYLVPGSTFTTPRPPLLGIYPEGTPIQYHPHIDAILPDGSCGVWTAAQSDILAEDWELVGEPAADPSYNSSIERVARDRAATLTCPKHADGMHRFTHHDAPRDQYVCACGRGALEDATFD